MGYIVHTSAHISSIKLEKKIYDPLIETITDVFFLQIIAHLLNV